MDDTRHSASLARNLSLVLEEHTRRTIRSVDQTLILLLNRHAQDPAAFDPAAILAHDLAPVGLPITVSLLDRDGWLVRSSEPIPAPLNYSDRQHFRFHRANPGDRLFIGEPVPTRRTGRVMMRFSRSLLDAGGNFAGVMAVLLDPAYFVRLYQGMSLGDRGIVSLFSREGEEFIRRVGDTISFGDTLRDGPMLDLIRRFPDGEAFDGLVADQPMLASARLLDDLPVGVLLGLNREETLADYRQKTTENLIGGGVVTVVVAVLGWLLVRRIRSHAAAASALDQASRAAAAASAGKSAFLAGMSHELRTPLNAILGYSEAMGRDIFGPLDDRYRDYADRIHRSGSHLLALITDMVDAARLETGDVTVAEERVVLPALLEDCLSQVRDRPDAAGLDIQLMVGRELPDLRADSRRLRQVLMNVLSNAVTFTPAGGQVTLHATAGLSGVMLVVQGTGVGIAAEDLRRVLEPFEQGENPLDRSDGGIGLGLPLARGLTRLMGGTLHIDSAPGRGTTVTVLFPPDRVIPAAAPPPPEISAGS